MGLPGSELGLRSGWWGRQEESGPRKPGHPRSGAGKRGGREGVASVLGQPQGASGPPMGRRKKELSPLECVPPPSHAARHRPPAFGLN